MEQGKAKDPLQARLGDLREELTKGERHLEVLDQQRQQVRDTLLRISGAIQVLDELLQQETDRNGADTGMGREVSEARIASVPA